jgi:hypothetical protein
VKNYVIAAVGWVAIGALNFYAVRNRIVTPGQAAILDVGYLLFAVVYCAWPKPQPDEREER